MDKGEASGMLIQGSEDLGLRPTHASSSIFVAMIKLNTLSGSVWVDGDAKRDPVSGSGLELALDEH